MANVTIPRYAKIIMLVCAIFMPVFLILPFLFWEGNGKSESKNSIINDPAIEAARLAPIGKLTIGEAIVTPETTVAVFNPEQTYQSVCATCHATGISGAPKFGDTAAWKEKIAERGSIDAIVKQATQGINAMPPKGGGATISDDDFKQMVNYMLEHANIKP